MNKLPKIYCLTIPGSDRHKSAHEQLSKLGLKHEFVYGSIHDEKDIPWDSICDLNKGKINTRYHQRCYGCKKGHIDLLNKAINDMEDYCISCEDDVFFSECNWDKVLEYCNKLDDLGGILNLGSNVMGYDYWFQYWDYRDDQFIYSKQWATDTCFALNKDGMQFYINGLLKYRKESDVSMCDMAMHSNRLIPSLTQKYSPIVLNPMFYRYSNIQI